MKLTALFITYASAHGTMKAQPGPASITPEAFGVHYYTQGTWIGCAKPTGKNCGGVKVPSAAPCCEDPMQPTLTSVDQVSYQNFTLFAGASAYASVPKTLYAEGFETIKPVNGKLRGALRSKNAESAKSFAQVLETDPFKYNPWFAPGHAPIASPCGILGGWRYSSARDYIAGPGDGYEKLLNHTGGALNPAKPPANMSIPAGTKGTDALMYDQNMRMQKAQGQPYRTNDNANWKAGGIQEVSYSLKANHGGGVNYRLCKLDNLFTDSLTEDCFQSMPLDFVGDTSWFDYKNTSDNSNRSAKQRIPFTAVRVNDANTNGVLPKGSTWTKVGLPACAGFRGGHCPRCDAPQFENELSKAGFWGYGGHGKGNSPAFKEVLENYEIVDNVRVPEGLDGDYVLSWRWDSEQTAQVWTQCSVVTIEP